MYKLIKVIILTLFLNNPAYAKNWSMNIGYNNPPGANLGLNFMYNWTNWAFETGIGSIKHNSTNNGQTNSTTSVLGAINLKYLFSSGTFRPYLQYGVGSSVSVIDNSGVSATAGVGGAYGGGGIFLMGQPIYAYLSYNSGQNTSFSQIGIGFQF